uniref:Uncharacterized protein n=1 Tax=Cacopsylla melanoneura TaxID=428564 RepID=A0A8D8Y6R5_9HEMI
MMTSTCLKTLKSRCLIRWPKSTNRTSSPSGRTQTRLCQKWKTRSVCPRWKVFRKPSRLWSGFWVCNLQNGRIRLSPGKVHIRSTWLVYSVAVSTCWCVLSLQLVPSQASLCSSLYDLLVRKCVITTTNYPSGVNLAIIYTRLM